VNQASAALAGIANVVPMLSLSEQQECSDRPKHHGLDVQRREIWPPQTQWSAPQRLDDPRAAASRWQRQAH
jgi:hypothetical protein